MKKFLNTLFSMKVAGIILVFLAVILAVATFIENDFGARYAKEVVYASWWFELLLFVMAINLTGAVFKYQLYKKEKLSRGIFHISFVIVLAGGFFTKHFAVEGMMHIRENDCAEEILMENMNLYTEVSVDENVVSQQFEVDNSMFYKVGEVAPDNKEDFKVDIYHYPVAHVPVLYESESGSPVMLLMFASQFRSYALPVFEGQEFFIDNIRIGFNVSTPEGLKFDFRQDSLSVTYPEEMMIRRMMGGSGENILEANTPHALNAYTIYETEDFRFVLTDFMPEAIVRYEQDNSQQNPGAEILMVIQSDTKTLFFPVVRSEVAMPANKMSFEDVVVEATWQPATIDIPFSVCLKDFQIERYPGSESPSEYRSFVELTDSREDTSFPFEIYMNNILKYNGYRFYQSSFDQDEKGTVLSVRKDRTGTFLTYLGYFLMIFSMIWALADKNSRFRLRLRSLSNAKTVLLIPGLIILALIQPRELKAQNKPVEPDKEIAASFGQLQALGANGRLMPVNTLSDEVLRTLYGKSKYQNMNSDQVLLSMIADPQNWMGEKILKVKFEDLRKRLQIKESYASFNDIVDPGTGQYLLSKDIEEAYNKKPVYRTKYDREVIKIDERLNVFYLILTNRYIKMYPVDGESGSVWLAAEHNLQNLSSMDSLFITNAEATLGEALFSKNNVKAQKVINDIDSFQHKNASVDIIPDNKIKAEIFSNRADVFNRLWRFYSTFGFFMIIVFIINVARPFRRYAWMSKVGFIHLLVAFIIHTAALGLRWYISGHAPWSNGYESLVFMAWSAMLAGLLFYKREPFALWSTSVLTAMVLMVAHLSWMNPQISNLVPVLKSVWLTIHVSVITSSYGFLGLSAIIALSAIILQIAAGTTFKENIENAIKRLTAISEIIMIPGLYLLTIGTFLGAIWANVSWGRYWGWDPKETWALITILIYAFVIHLKYIPGLKGRYFFNVMTVIAFFSILMTYFGVNYYLSGLHSYAGGDPVPIPAWLYFAVGSLFLIFIAGNFMYKSSRPKE